MKQCILLPNELFDDGGIECRTFVVCAPGEDTLVCEYGTIQRHYAQYVDAIKAAMRDGKRYVGMLMELPPNDPRRMSFGETLAYGEIQWD